MANVVRKARDKERGGARGDDDGSFADNVSVLFQVVVGSWSFLLTGLVRYGDTRKVHKKR